MRKYKNFLIILFSVVIFTLPILKSPNKIATLTKKRMGHDIELHLAILNYNIKTFKSLNLKNIFDFPFYYPYSNTATRGVNLYGQSIIAFLFFIAGIKNLHLLYNITAFIGFLLLSLSIYSLLKTVSGDENSFLIWTVVFTFMGYKFLNYKHINLLFIFPSILILKQLYLIVKDDREGIKDSLILLILIVLQALFSLTALLLLFIIIPLWFLSVYITKYSLKIKLKLIIKSITPFFVGILIIFILFMPYFLKTESIQNTKIKKETIKEHTRTIFFALTKNFFYSQTPLNRLFYKKNNLKYRGLLLLPGYFSLIILFFSFFYLSKKNILSFAYILIFFALLINNLFLGNNLLFNLTFFLFFTLNTYFLIKLWKIFDFSQKFSSLLLIIFLFIFFSPPYKILPLSINYLYILSNLFIFKFLLRLRSPNFYVFMPIFWLIFLSSMSKNIKSKKLKIALFFIILLEVFPYYAVFTKTYSQKLKTFDKNLYSELKKFPDYYGIIELPRPLTGIYIKNTILHKKHTYNARGYGVGPMDKPLNLRENMRNTPLKALFSSNKFLKLLKENGFYIIIVHKKNFKKEFFRGCRRKNIKNCNEKKWEKHWKSFIKNFKRIEKKGFIENFIIKNEGVLFSIPQKQEGKKLCYSLPTYALKGKKYIVIKLEKYKKNQKIKLKFNDVLREKMIKSNSITLKLNNFRLNLFEANKICILSNTNISIKNIKITDRKNFF